MRSLQLLLAASSLSVLAVLGAAHDLDDLATQKDYQSHRLTSTDPKGGNEDFWTIAPGQTRTLADTRGPGRIVHFRDNITSSEPHHLQLHVLRI